MRVRRIAARVALLAGAGAACLAAGIFPQEPLRAFLEARLRAFGSAARVGHVFLVPIRLRVDVDDLVVPSAGVLFSARRVRLALSPSFLFGDAPRIHTLEMDGASLEIQASGGTVRLPVLIDDLRIIGATVVYKDASLGGDLVLHGLDVRGGLGAGSLEVRLRDGVWARPQPLAFGPVDASLRVSPMLAIDVETLDAHAGPSWLRGHGTLGRVGAWSPSLDLEGSADLAALSRDLSLPPSRGTVSAQVTLEGSGNGLKAKASLKAAALAVGQWPAEDVGATLAYDGRDPGRQRATLLVVGKSLGGVMDGTAQLVGRALEARFSARGLDLARLSRAAGASPMSGRITAEAEARGNMDSTVDTRAHGEVSAELGALATRTRGDVEGKVDVATRVANLTWALAADGHRWNASTVPGFAGFEGTVSGTARGAWPPALDGGGEATLDIQTGVARERLPVTVALHSDGTTAALSIDGRGLDGAFHGEALARGAALERLEVSGERLDLARVGPALGGRLSFRLTSAGLPPDAEGRGSAEVDALAWRGAAFGAASMTLAATRGEARLGLSLPGLRLRADGLVPVTLRGDLTGKADMTDSPLQPLGPLFSQDTPLDGSVRGSVDFTIPLATPLASRAEAHVEHLAVSSGKLSAESARAFGVDIVDRRVTLSDLSLRGPGYSLEASGRFGLGEHDPVAVDVAASADLASIPSPPGWILGGRVAGRVAISGSPNAPLANGAFGLRDVSVRPPTGPAMSAAEGRVELSGDVITLRPLPLRIGAGSGNVSARARWGAFSRAATGCEASELSADWSNVEVAELLAWRSAGAAPIQAALSGRLDSRGCPTRPTSLSGRLHLDDAVIHMADVSLNLSPADLRIAEGRVSTDGLTLWTDDGSLQAGGEADLGRRTLDLRADGSMNLRALSPLAGAASFAGSADVSLGLQGPFASPRPRGQIWLRDMSVRVRDIPDTLTDVNGTVVVDATSVRLEETHARLGGGDVTASGSARLQGALLSDVNVSVTGRDLALRYPPGLRSRSNADIAVTGKSGALKLGGTVHVLRGLYALDAATQSVSTPAAVAEPSPLLQSIALALRIDLDGPVLIRNRLASLDITGNLTFRGDMASPSPLGRLDIRRGGHVYIQTRDFSVESGGLLYEGTWDPTVSLRATKRIRGKDPYDLVKDFDVELVADGPLSTVQPTLRAPGLSDAQTFSLVTTGDSRSAALSAGASVVGGHAANLMVGRLSQSLGLDEVSVQPELLARETDPGTRFTFGKQLSAAVSLIYSMGLSGPEERFVQLQARPYRGVTLTGQRTDDGALTGGVGQRLLFGGPPHAPSAREIGIPIESVRVEGDASMADKDLRDAVQSRAGKKATPWSVQEDADRLRARLVEKGFIEAEVGGRLEDAVVVFRIRSGPRFTWRVTGMPDPPELGKVIRNALFEEDALERGRAKLLEDSRRGGFLRALVVARALDEGGGRTLLFEATPGRRFEAEVRFPGATVLSPKDLLRAAGSPGEILASPDKATQRIRDAYRLRQRLMVKVDEPRVDESGTRVVISLHIDEGPAARVASVRFEGATQPDADLRKIAGLAAGDAFLDTGPPGAADRVRQHYLGLGFPHVRVMPEVTQKGADVDVVFRIDEGESLRVGRIEIVGLGRTHEALVRSRVDLAPGDPLDPRRLALVERRILELGIFARVLVTASDDSPATVTIELVEDARVAASYDVRYNDQDAGTGQVDAEVRNLFGVGLKAGGRYKAGRDIREARGSLFVPSPLRVGNVIVAAFRQQEDFDQTDPLTGEPFVNVQTDRGFQVQQTLPLHDRWLALVGYGWKRISSTAFAVPTDDAGIDTSLVRDTRDNPLDARRGRFYGLTLTYSPQALGSDITFIKGFAQAFFVRSLGPSWLWAHGYRLGLAKGYGGQDVYYTERFKAGGANSLRGFATDGVGPRDFLGEPKGGEAVVIVNQELRYMSARKMGAAFFYDVGNVFETVSDMSFAMKHTLGLGLRWQSPVGLLRLDFGFPLNRDPLVDRTTGERLDKPLRIFFSLGQAF